MAQFARPNSDDTVGDWAVAPLWSKVNESATNDSPFITANGQAACVMTLTPVDNPEPGTVTLRVRARKPEGVVGELHATLLEGATERAVRVFPGLSTSWATASFTLTTGERDSIVSWSNLRIRLAYVGGGEGAVLFDGEAVTFDGEVVTYAGT